MKNSSVSKKPDAHTRTFSFANFCPEINKHGLYVTPFDIADSWTMKNQFKSFLKFSFHSSAIVP